MGILSFLSGGKRKKRKGRSASRKNAAGQKAPRKSLPDIELPAGPCEIEVEGLYWCKIPLSDNDDRVFSLTPRNDYQEENDWPEPGCVNVNRNGSRRTTGKNWVGYIPAFKAAKLNSVVMSHGTTRVHARVRTAPERSVVLMLPEKYRM